MFEKRMKNHYDTEKDLYDRLNGTIVTYRNDPCWLIMSGGSPHTMTLETYPNGEYKKVSHDDPDLDISSLELGYANIDPKEDYPKKGLRSQAIYYSRSPERQYRQGLCPGRIKSNSVLIERTLSWAPSIPSKGFTRMLKDEYPSVHEAIWNLNSDVAESVAISRDVALVQEKSGIITVALKMENIGVLLPSSNEILVKDHEFIWVLKRIFSRFQIKLNRF